MSEPRPEVHIMLDFMYAQSRLPRAVQSKTSKLILQLKADPSAHGVNWESIEGARDRHMKSARVDLSYRAIVYNRGNAEGVGYNYNYTRQNFVTGIPLLPNLGIRADF